MSPVAPKTRPNEEERGDHEALVEEMAARRRAVAGPEFPQVVELLHDHDLRVAGHQSRAAAHRRIAVARDAVADGYPHRARSAAVRPVRAVRRRLDRSRVEAADR